MKVILLQEVEKLGARGTVVAVRDGFGRNFLLPRRLAVVATPETEAAFQKEKARSAERSAEAKEKADELARRLASLKLRLEVEKVGKDKKLFGSVTAQEVAESLALQGISLNRKKIIFAEPIRTLGTHSVTAKLHPQVKSTFQVEVVKKS